MFQCRDIDALMMDWLYGELAPQKAQSFSAHVEGCSRCHDELAAYQRTRELVSELPSEEPPAALSALLIREAAARSPSPRAEAAGEGGILAWLARLFQPLQHPALAAVATLVLVAGVAGTLYLRDGDQHFAEPKMAAPPETSAPAPAAIVDDREQEEAADENIAAPAPTTGETADKDSGRRADLLEAKKKEVAADLLVKTRKDAPGRRKQGGKNKRKPSTIEDSYKANVVSGADPLPLDEKKPAPPEPAFEGAASDRPYRAYRDRPDAWVNAQQLRITEAYNRNDCRTAARIANDILDRSPELYTKRTRNLEAIKRCKVYVQREKSRRAVARKQRNSTSSGKAATKAKKAPQPAPAADVEQATE